MLTRIEIDFSQSLIARAEVRLERHKESMPGASQDARLADLSLLSLMEARLVMMRGQHATLIQQRDRDDAASAPLPGPHAILPSGILLLQAE